MKKLILGMAVLSVIGLSACEEVQPSSTKEEAKYQETLMQQARNIGNTVKTTVKTV